MSKYGVKEIEKKDIWEKFVLSQKPKTFLQSWNWGEVNRQMGDKIFRLGFFQDEKLVGACLAIVKRAKRGPHIIVAGGPLIDWDDSRLVQLFLEEIEKIARKERVWFVRIRPELLDNESNRKRFAKMGFVSAPMHLHAENTWVLDIRASEEKILAGMRKNTRYSVRKSLKSGLKLEISKDPKDAEILKKLQEETVKRHGFVGFSEKLFRAQIEKFGKDIQAKLFLCKKGDEVLVAAIIIFYGNCAYYHHSASSEVSRKIPASYFLQWKIICDAKENGMDYYNFWGIAPEGVKKHRFMGVTTFKTGFGGERVDWLHAQDLPIKKSYWLTFLFESGRKIARGL
jgi:lipid II:glycine glycyltransferase (peptidoglycan interpeptide bridge formation enzyme)